MDVVEEEWLRKEVKLSQKHEQILAQREALFNGTEAYYDTQRQRSSEFVINYHKALERNASLKHDLEKTRKKMKQLSRHKTDSQLPNLQKNYWSMVKANRSQWEHELREYQKHYHHHGRASPSHGRTSPSRERSSPSPGHSSPYG